MSQLKLIMNRSYALSVCYHVVLLSLLLIPVGPKFVAQQKEGIAVEVVGMNASLMASLSPTSSMAISTPMPKDQKNTSIADDPETPPPPSSKVEAKIETPHLDGVMPVRDLKAQSPRMPDVQKQANANRNTKQIQQTVKQSVSKPKTQRSPTPTLQAGSLDELLKKVQHKHASQPQRNRSTADQFGNPARKRSSQMLTVEEEMVALLQGQIRPCYLIPLTQSSNMNLPVINFTLNKDGSLSRDPINIKPSTSAVEKAFSNAAISAIKKCAPFSIPERFKPFYSRWKDVTAEFAF